MDEFILAILFIALIGFCLFVKSYFPNGCERRRNLKVLITGSTRGIGFALAKRFLELGDSVVITGRSQKSVDKALDELAMKNVFGVVCDVRDAASVQEALEFAADKLHHVDIVINNAGISYDKLAPIFDVEAETLRDVVDTNLVGSLFVAKFALQLFRKQKAGMLWLMDGAGSQGRATALFSAYGASKAAIPQLKKSLNAELKKENLPKEIGVKCCSPGMVLTDLLLHGKEKIEKRLIFVFNVLCEKPNTVANWLVPRIRLHSEKRGGKDYLKFLTIAGAIYRFCTFFKRKNRFFNDNGELIE